MDRPPLRRGVQTSRGVFFFLGRPPLRVSYLIYLSLFACKRSNVKSGLTIHLSIYLSPPRAPSAEPPAATVNAVVLVADDGRLAPFSHARADQLCLTAARKCSCDIGCPRTRVRRRRVRAAEPAAAALSTVAVDGRLAPFSHARADQLCLTAARKCSCDIGCPRTRVGRCEQRRPRADGRGPRPPPAGWSAQ
jgi:hypothetical protein